MRTDLYQKFERDLAALTVYTPDTVRSQLIGHLDHFICAQTGFSPFLRFWTRHDMYTAEQFYRNRIPVIAEWHLVTRLLVSGPSLVTIWMGHSCFEVMNALKGSAHPADANPGTIRGRFWCDNSVCNLIHVSDDAERAIREFDILQANSLRHRAVAECHALTESREPVGLVRHCALLELRRAILRMVDTSHVPCIPGQELSACSSSAVLFRYARRKLEEVAGRDPEIAEVLDFYFQGKRAQFLGWLDAFVPLTDWERFVIECGLVDAQRWTRLSLHELIASVARKLNDAGGWLVSGSAALRLLGMDVRPRDLDLRCSDDTLNLIARRLSVPVEKAILPSYTAPVAKLTVGGWEVEFVGTIHLANGVDLTVDDEMLRRAKAGNACIQPVEDLIAEFLAMNRGEEKNDFYKAKTLFRRFANVIDREYLARRLKKWRLDVSVENYLAVF